MKEDCFGTSKKDSPNRYQGYGYQSMFNSAESYGKSAYMLIYERKEKKPLRIIKNIVVKEEGKEKKEEEIELIPYDQVN
jgi:hypothetical protein